MSTRSISGMTNRFGDMTIGSPTPIKNMETSLTQSGDTEIQVSKINAMFPTVSDTHIRLLLKKWDETVSIWNLAFFLRELNILILFSFLHHWQTCFGYFLMQIKSRSLFSTNSASRMFYTYVSRLESGSIEILARARHWLSSKYLFNLLNIHFW